MMTEIESDCGILGASPAAEVCLPEISRFFGIVIQMFWRDHAPPHFHALYGEHEAVIAMRSLRVLAAPCHVARCS